jgi:hypothetical protein
MTSKKNPNARYAVIGAVSFVMVGAFIAACGLDDTILDESSSGGASGSDATIGADGTTVIPDGATKLPDGDIIFVDAGPDGTIHIISDAADPVDANLSDAAVAIDGGCASGQYTCSTGGNVYCLDDCSLCNGFNYGCASTSTCVASCADCSENTECFRSGFFGHKKYCVENPAACTSIGGNHVFCGQLPFYYVDCPGTDQVCASNECLTCGETGTTGDTCSPSSSGSCKNPGPTCQ